MKAEEEQRQERQQRLARGERAAGRRLSDKSAHLSDKPGHLSDKQDNLSDKSDEAHDKAARLDAIKRLIRERTVGTQDELGRLLHGEGFHVTQGTLSRDLTQLGALRVARPGGSAYELLTEPEPLQRLRALGELVLFISDNEAMAVVRTQPGAANAVARAIDQARIPECLGSIAGDDTIFLTPVRGAGARRLSNALRALLGEAAGNGKRS